MVKSGQLYETDSCLCIRLMSKVKFIKKKFFYKVNISLNRIEILPMVFVLKKFHFIDQNKIKILSKFVEQVLEDHVFDIICNYVQIFLKKQYSFTCKLHMRRSKSTAKLPMGFLVKTLLPFL